MNDSLHCGLARASGDPIAGCEALWNYVIVQPEEFDNLVRTLRSRTVIDCLLGDERALGASSFLLKES